MTFFNSSFISHASCVAPGMAVLVCILGFISKTVGQIYGMFGANIHGSPRMKLTDLTDPLTFPLALCDKINFFFF